jgi:hypothetical protein
MWICDSITLHSLNQTLMKARGSKLEQIFTQTWWQSEDEQLPFTDVNFLKAV